MATLKRKKIGEIFIEKDFLATDALDEALEFSQGERHTCLGRPV